MTTNPPSSGRTYDAALIRRLAAYLEPYRAGVIAAAVLLVGHSALAAAGPFITKVAVDRSLRPTPLDTTFIDRFLPEDRAAALLYLTAAYVAVLLLSYALRAVHIYVVNLAGQRAMRDLRARIFGHLQSKSVAFFDRSAIGRLVTRVTQDVETLNELFTSGVAAIAGDLVTLVFILAAMLYLSPMLTILLLLVAPLVALVSIVFRKHAREGYRAVRTAVGRINAYLQETLSGVAIVQLFNREVASAQEFERLNAAHREANLRAIQAHAIFYPVIEWLGVFAVAMLLAGGGWLVEQEAVTLGVLVAFLQYGVRVFRPIQDLSEKFNVLQSAMASSERIFGLLDTPVDELPSKEANKGLPAAARIEFRNVWFAYEGEDWVLRGVSFTVEPGRTLAIVGHTGAGKTTLINLLLRFYEPQRGEIFVGGKEIRHWPRETLRRQFGTVLQDPYVFSGTIAANIGLQDPNISQTAIHDAARAVEIDAFVRSLPQGYDAPAGERGASFSTGQKQLLGFARALAGKPPFLILDEATSSVDPETERRIRAAVPRLVERRTSIVIAHRLSTVRRANQILVLHKGKVREIGAHGELLLARGIYWKLYQLQFEDQESVRRDFRTPNSH